MDSTLIRNLLHLEATQSLALFELKESFIAHNITLRCNYFSGYMDSGREHIFHPIQVIVSSDVRMLAAYNFN